MLRNCLVTALLALAFLGACDSSPAKQDVGMVTGAAVGGLLGHQIGGGSSKTIATICGAASGAFLGSRIGKSMDRDDQLEAAQALERSSDNRVTVWRNSNARQGYSVTPTRTYSRASCIVLTRARRT